MAIIEGGTSASLADIGANTKALREEARPIDVGVLGAYQISYVSGTMAAGLAGGSTIFSVRWGDATRTMLIRRVSFLAQNAGTAFTAGLCLFDMVVARAFTASDSAGTAVVLTGNQGKKRTSFGSSLVTDMRGSSTAALTVGTRTLDTLAVDTILGAVEATATNYLIVPSNKASGTAAAIAATAVGGARAIDFWYPEISNSWPLVLVQNEGFIIRATVPATGTWRFVVEIEWAEVASTAGFN
jgi:hypothetical protein